MYIGKQVKLCDQRAQNKKIYDGCTHGSECYYMGGLLDTLPIGRAKNRHIMHLSYKVFSYHRYRETHFNARLDIKS